MSFTQIAVAEMHRLKNDYGTQVGSRYEGDDAEGLTRTDCITYVRRVLEHTFHEIGENGHKSGVRDNYTLGSKLANYLTNHVNWKAYYWNPDTRRPADHDPEHPSSFRQVVQSGKYDCNPVDPEAKIEISGLIVNYRPTVGVGYQGRTNKDTRGLVEFKLVPFAFGLARGGQHTFLISNGEVFEVHWDAIGENLYEVSSFDNYEWLSGAVVIPPDAFFALPQDLVLGPPNAIG